MQLKGEGVAVREMRKHASWYLKGIRGNGKVRTAINQIETAVELRALLDEVKEHFHEMQQVEAI
ncbi:tRNA-dihydrouridine synthase OS=Ureibacillus acetophenoni OX=614649 GN=SAMN05877842_1244 PE=3 SV=1 [Ureibacillus acetophenoni]